MVGVGVLLGDEVHEVEVRAVLAVAALGGLADEVLADVEGAPRLLLVGGVETRPSSMLVRIRAGQRRDRRESDGPFCAAL